MGIAWYRPSLFYWPAKNVAGPEIAATAFCSTGVDGWKIYADVGVLDFYFGAVAVPTCWADMSVIGRIVL